jgi:hypothetical protein
MSSGVQVGNTTRFVLIAVKHEAAYWTPQTIARELRTNELLDDPTEAGLAVYRDEVLRGLVGRAAERFWASDAVTPSRAAAIRSACKALHELTIDVYSETASDPDSEPSATPARTRVKPAS